jgi:hypothetical protein
VAYNVLMQKQGWGCPDTYSPVCAAVIDGKVNYIMMDPATIAQAAHPGIVVPESYQATPAMPTGETGDVLPEMPGDLGINFLSPTAEVETPGAVQSAGFFPNMPIWVWVALAVGGLALIVLRR